MLCESRTVIKKTGSKLETKIKLKGGRNYANTSKKAGT